MDEQGRNTGSLMSQCWMSADKGGYEDMFSAAVQLATELHKTHVQSVQVELEQEQLKNKTQESRIQELNDVIQRMRQVLSKAKAKIRSQRDNNNNLRELLRRLAAVNPSLMPLIPSESPDLSGDELESALRVLTTSASPHAPTNDTSAAPHAPTNHTSAAPHPPSNDTSAAPHPPSNDTSAAPHPPTNHTSASDPHAPTNDTSAVPHPPTNHTSAAPHAPTMDASARPRTPTMDTSAAPHARTMDTSARPRTPTMDASARPRTPTMDASARPRTPTMDTSAGLHARTIDTSAGPHARTIDKSISLFSNTPASMAATPTPQLHDGFITSGPLEEGGVESPESNSSTVASGHDDSDVIIVGQEDVTRPYPSLAPNGILSQSGIIMAVPDGGIRTGALPHGTSMDEVEILGVSEQDRSGNSTALSHSVSTDDDDDEQQPDVQANRELESRSTTTDEISSSLSRRVLSLKDTSSKVRYKELERASNNLSSSSSMSSGSNPPHTISPSSTHNDSDTSEGSPSLLRSSDNCSRKQPSPESPQVDISPSALGPPMGRPVMFTGTVPTGPQIPNSDSQLSLDISETMPPSPELHSTARKYTHSGKEQHDAVLSHQIQMFAADKPSSYHKQVTKSMKPPVPQSLGNGKEKRRRKKPRTFKQTTLTQNPIDNDLQEQCHYNKPPNHNVSTIEQVQTNTSMCETPTGQSFLPITPGLRPVSSILYGKNWANDSESYSCTGGQVAPGSKRSSRNGCQMDESEDVLPRKKAHLLPHVPLDNGCTGKGCNALGSFLDSSTEDNDVTRLVEREAFDREPSPEYNPQCYKRQQTGEDLFVSDSVLPSPTVLYDSKGVPVAMGTSGPSSVNGSGLQQDLLGRREELKEHPMDTDEYARALAAKAGLPTFKCVAPMRRKADRDRLDAKPCSECIAWYGESDGIHRDKRDHLKHTCRHKDLYLPPDTDDRMWDISFPDSEECERILQK